MNGGKENLSQQKFKGEKKELAFEIGIDLCADVFDDSSASGLTHGSDSDASNGSE